MHMCWSQIKLYVKNYEAVKILRYLNFEKKTLFRDFLRKKMLLPPKSWPIWTKFLLEVLHIMDYLHEKFH